MSAPLHDIPALLSSDEHLFEAFVRQGLDIRQIVLLLVRKDVDYAKTLKDARQAETIEMMLYRQYAKLCIPGVAEMIAEIPEFFCKKAETPNIGNMNVDHYVEAHNNDTVVLREHRSRRNRPRRKPKE